MYQERHITHDAASVEFDTDAPGIDDGDDGDVEFDWDEIETVHVEDPPWQTAFDAKEFYKIPATVARPIEQTYRVSSDDSDGDDTVTLMKPREELKDAAWSLDNSPWTMNHPSTGVVKDVGDVRGFWRSPRYVDGLDDLDANLHVPTDDEEAKEFLEQYQDVSVGFYNSVVRTDEYEGVTGDAVEDESGVDGYQTNIMFDHVASVPIGRCPSEKGCGLSNDSKHGHIADSTTAFKNGTDITEGTDGEATHMEPTADAPQGIYATDGEWYAVGPDEHDKDSTDHTDDAMYPVGSCSSVEDAWKLRSHGEDLSIEQSTLEARIKRAGEGQDCSGLPWMDADTDCGECGDCGCDPDTNDTDNTMNLNIDFDDLTASAVLAKVADEHEGVASELDEMREYEADAEAAQDAMQALECDEAEGLADCVESLQDERDALEQRVDELTQPKIDSAAEDIAEMSDRWEDAEAVKEDHDGLEDLQSTKELLDDAVPETDEQTANPDPDENEGTEASFDTSYDRTPEAWG